MRHNSVAPTQGAPELQFRVDQQVTLRHNTDHPSWKHLRRTNPDLREVIAENVIVEDIVFNQFSRRFHLSLDKRLGMTGITFDGVTGLQHSSGATLITAL